MPNATQPAGTKRAASKARPAPRRSAALPPTPAVAIPDSDPVLQFLNARLQEGENATPEEQIEAEAQFQSFARSLNANRRTNGERPLYPGVG